MKEQVVGRVRKAEISEVVTAEDRLIFIKTGQLKKNTADSMKKIRKQYKTIAFHGGKNELDQLFLEHYYLIEREGKSFLKEETELYLPAGRRETLPDIVRVMTCCMASPEFTFSTESLIQTITAFEHKRKIKNFELDFILYAIKLAAIGQLLTALLNRGEVALSMAQKAIQALFAIKTINLAEISKRQNHLDRLLSSEPYGCYHRMNDITRELYRYKLCMTALAEGKDELYLAEEYLARCRESGQHIGFFIYEDYARLFEKKRSAKLYIPMLTVVPAITAVLLGILSGNIWLPFILYFPLWAVYKPVIDFLCVMPAKSEYLPRMELSGEIPTDGRTLITITTLLPNAKELGTLKRKLEKVYLTNCTGDIKIVLLADLKENKLPSTAEDKLLIRLTQKLIRELNWEYDQHFFLVVRKRSYSKTQQIYTGAERKRGAINTLVDMIMGRSVELEAFEGEYDFLKGVKYLYALDDDTKALMNTAEQLVSVAMHPLNRPVVDEESMTVRQGYGILAPRIGIDLRESLKTPFARIMGGLGGVSAYDKGCGELYQDLFGEGIFAGKGLIDVPLYDRLLKDRFPSETVLSHDILEGCFLRTAFVSDIELLDGFPQSAAPYYKRLHRWIRGDFQNITYIFPRLKVRDQTLPNPINRLSRFKLFDNLRRAFSPFFTVVCLLLSLLLEDKTAAILAAVGALSAISDYLFGICRTLLSGGFFTLSRKYYSKTLPQTFALLSQCGYALVLLPKTAINGLDAALRALYRRFVSHKKLLEWTTAAQAEKGKNAPWHILVDYWYTVLFGLLFVLLGRGFLRLLGILFLCAIPVVLYSQKRYRSEHRTLSDTETDALLSVTASMWEYYQDFANEKENWLPPDNMQEAPVYYVAHRTSPTNIGMMLLSALSARDMGLIDTEAMTARLTHTIDTVERMQKYHGNLYNWYSTRSLAVLEPQYVSTVDSGNFVCCLVALKEGIREYKGESPDIEPLAVRIEKLIENTDLSVFYDENKKLFSIGYDSKADRLNDSSYDMLMSEARMTSYFAIAKRQVPLKHWSALGRTLARLNFYTGPISWTGTMFEYFMPELLLHCMDGSLGYEGLRFCLYCQKRRAKQKGVPFGISESGYYAFDAELNYQYQAFGVQKLALKKGQNLNTVISPYSSFLALPYDFDAAYRNLSWLKKIGVFGKYGFYEAIDFTGSRIIDNPYQIVKSYMAHHIGMSIIAVNNALNDRIMQRRFLRDKEMNRANELLQEKVMTGSTVYRDIDRRELARHNPREESMNLEYSNIYPQNPRAYFLSNGEITSVMTDCGTSFLKYQQKDLTRRSTDLLRRPLGVFAYVKYRDKVLPFTYAPDYDNRYDYRIKLGANTVSYVTADKELQTGMKVSLHPVSSCEQRQFVLYNGTQHRREAEMLVYLEPVLSFFRDDAAHPAFSKLFLQVKYDRVSNTLVVSRRERTEDTHPIFLAVGFLEDVPFEYEANREKVLTRPYGIFSLQDAFEKQFAGGSGTPDPCVAIRWKTAVSPKGQQEFTLVLSAGRNESQAINGIIAMRAEGRLKDENAAHPIIPSDSIEGRIASSILPQILFPKPDSSLILESIKKLQCNRTALWQYGVSGDLPIVLLELQSDQEIDRVKNYISCQKRMKMCHIKFDLVFLYQEEEDYHQPILQMIKAQAGRLGQDSMIDSAGGIHPVNIMGKEEAVDLFRAVACHIAPKSMVRLNMPTERYTPIRLLPIQPSLTDQQENGFRDDGYCIREHPSLPWSHVMANPAFGTLLSDHTLGYTWAVNARENKLTPWYNDTMSDHHGELLVLRYKDRYYNLTDHAAVIFSPEFASYSGQIGGLSFLIKVTVPQKSMVKRISVFFHNRSKRQVDFDLAYYTEPVLGVDRRNAKYILSECEENLLLFHNSFWQTIPAYMGITCDSPSKQLYDRAEFWSGRWGEPSGTPNYDPCGTLIVKKELPPGRKEKLEFILGYAATKKGLKELLTTEQGEEHRTENTVRICTPDDELNAMINSWLPWQTTAARLYGRTGFYQCGGAWGFRDQLQDAANLAILSPKLLKRHICRACASQFPEGDVLHWWHNLPREGKKGVRTRYSDDLLWLVYAVCEYVEKTDDRSILDIAVHFADAPLLKSGEKEQYVEVKQASEKASVYEHCLRAINKANRLGLHGLALMGCGDWNDGYNRVGEEGKGESVWLTQFLAYVMRRFAVVAGYRDEKQANDLKKTAASLLNAVDETAWDGAWYLRAFFDNGDKMGSKESNECKIDSLTQSFSVITDMPDRARTRLALKSVMEHLVDWDRGLVRLFSPSYADSEQEPGYVKAYPVGLRENGGQYTHAAVWYAMAVLLTGDADTGYRLLRLLNSASRYQNKEQGAAYQLEPYYMAADIYTNPNAYGRGGWSLYTGAAGWYYKAVIECLLGIRLQYRKLYIQPLLPKEWEGFTAELEIDDTKLEITVRKGKANKLYDNEKQTEFIPIDGGMHKVLCHVAKV